jgi:sulfate adenylyltransferase
MVTDPRLPDILIDSLGAESVTATDLRDPDWVRLLAAIEDEGPLPAVASSTVLSALRRWRPPRATRGLVVLFTGLSGSGKSTLARGLTTALRARGRTVSLLDGDRVRRLLSAGLGFDHAARDLNVRRIGFVAAEVARHGGIAVCAPIAPYAESRAAVRAMAREVGDFVLVHVGTPLEECERRDVKGLYARARAGQIEHFTGVSDPYEAPTDADITLDTTQLTEQEGVARVVGFLDEGGWSRPRLRS